MGAGQALAAARRPRGAGPPPPPRPLPAGARIESLSHEPDRREHLDLVLAPDG
jgi:hypothetical protein